MSSPTFTDYAPLVDPTLVEAGIQSFFVNLAGGNFAMPLDNADPNREKWTPPAGKTAIYTSFQELVFQAVRPRIAFGITGLSPYPSAYLLDANGVWRPKAWQGRVTFGIITPPDYAAHTQLRAKMLAILPLLQPVPGMDNSAFATTGVNALLTVHEVAKFTVLDFSTDLKIGDGYYQSTIPVELTFGVRSSAWPGTNQSN